MKASKKSFPFLLVTLTLFLGMTAFAQDEEKTKVHLKVIQNDEVTVDTTLQVTSGAESDELKKLIQEIAGIEDIDLQVLSSGDLHTHAIKLKKEGTDSLKTVAVFVGVDGELTDLEFIEEDEQVWVSKGGVDDHTIIMKSGKGDAKVYAVVSGDKKDIKVIHEKADSLKVILEKDLKRVDEDKVGVYYVVKEKTDLDDVEEIVIKKKDGNVIIMKGDEIQDIKGGNIYIKTYDDEEGTFDVFLKNDEDGTVVVKNNVKVIKKQNEEGEEEIEITIIKKDTTKEKKEIKEKKAEKEKK